MEELRKKWDNLVRATKRKEQVDVHKVIARSGGV